MSSFWKRTLSGAVYVALVVASILVHPIFFGVLFLALTMWAVHEYHTLVKSDKFVTIGSMIAGGLTFVTLWLLVNGDSWLSISDLAYTQVAGLLLLMALLIAELFRKAEDPIRNWGNILTSLAMIALPFALMNIVLDKSPYILLALFITIWVNDSGAYCVGCSTAKLPKGNHKMFPRISPAKSWEGLIGGFVFALLAGYIFYRVGWFADYSHPCITALAFALVVAVFGTLGDLMESLIKRTVGVKDSGRFMPGHGGVLDRFDSILLATPAVTILLLLL